MTTDRELMQQALDALDDINQCSLPPTGIPLPAEIDHVMEALRARLSQPEQEPVAWITDGGKGELWWHQSVKFDDDGNLIGENPDDIPLYTAPPQQHSEQWWKHEVSNAFANGYEKGRASIKQPEQEPVAWTERELELIDGMIEVQVIHAERCDSIPNRAMAEKQKGWDMERVELLRKIRTTAPPQREWQGLTDDEVNNFAAGCHLGKSVQGAIYEAAAMLKEKNA